MMKRSFISCYKMMLCAAILAMSTFMVSCVDNDDNVTPTPPSDEYVLDVEEGMTLPVNAFLKVPAIDGDPKIITALKAIDKVTDVMAFAKVVGYDYWKDKVITKTAYFFNYKQDIDHNNPSKGWFKQQCVLTVEGQDRPTVLHTDGYALEGEKNQLDSISEPMLVSVLNANCLQVEHRYHGWSLPEGYTNKWHYLSTKQQSDDLHAIVTTIKQSGIVGNGKWLSTGTSKDGETTAYYAYHYPNDMDAYVPFCAPFLLQLEDKRPYSHIITKEALGDSEEKMNKVKAAFRAYAGNKTLQAQCVEIHKKENPNLTSTDEEIHLTLLYLLFENYYNKMSYVPYEKWENMIPAEGDSAQKFYNFIMTNSRTRYAEDTDSEYKRRQDTTDDLEPAGNGKTTPNALRRAASVTRHDPYSVQICIDLGGYGYVHTWVEDLLTSKEKTVISNDTDPATYGVTYDEGQFVKSFLDGMKQSNCHMMFVYGMQDPWTGAQIPDDKMGTNIRKLFIQHTDNPERKSAGLHNDNIDQWNPSERGELFKWLNQLGFLANE